LLWCLVNGWNCDERSAPVRRACSVQLFGESGIVLDELGRLHEHRGRIKWNIYRRECVCADHCQFEQGNYLAHRFCNASFAWRGVREMERITVSVQDAGAMLGIS